MIKVLDKNVAAKIAAGEVVDRPLSVVKELIENSIDAGATSITCEIKNGGKSYIRITDNGCGIPAEQVEIAFARHATSKISEEKDLDNILTLGFRGEALASISAVSRLELLTKIKDSKVGTRLILHGGEVFSKDAYGCPEGTTIIVKDLFYNTPARLKFLKSDTGEAMPIIDLISQIAIAYPDIKISLRNNDKLVFSTLGNGSLLGSILTVYKNQGDNSLVYLEEITDYAKVRGYISSPEFSRNSRKGQVFFVNGRVVNSKVIEKGVSDGYKERLFEGRFPLAYLMIEVSPDKVDVNIHPNKREVRFGNPDLISELVCQAVKNALAGKAAIPKVNTENKNLFTFENKKINTDKSNITEVKEYSRREEQQDIKRLLSTIRREQEENNKQITEKTDNNTTFNSSIVDENGRYTEFLDDKEKFDNSEKNIYFSEDVFPTLQRASSLFDISKLRPTGTIFATYITAVDDDSFYLIDQHAAHERIIYEKLLQQFISQEKIMQPLLVPIVTEVSYTQAANSNEWLDVINKMGFDVSEFGNNSFIIKALPMFMSLKEGEDFFNDFVDNYSEKSFEDYGRLEKIISNSCKSAIKGNDVIHNDEINQLLLSLSKCRNPFSCPHGRPTFLRFTKNYIESQFTL